MTPLLSRLQAACNFAPDATPPVTQRFVDHIVARAQNSAMGLGDPKSSYSLDNYADKSFEAVAMLLVTAHVEKYDLISLMLAVMQEAFAMCSEEKHLRTRQLAKAVEALNNINERSPHYYESTEARIALTFIKSLEPNENDYKSDNLARKNVIAGKAVPL